MTTPEQRNPEERIQALEQALDNIVDLGIKGEELEPLVRSIAASYADEHAGKKVNDVVWQEIFDRKYKPLHDKYCAEDKK